MGIAGMQFVNIHEGEIYCDVHGCIHAPDEDPYKQGPLPIGDLPECSIDDWRVLWIGRPYDGFYKESPP